MSPADDEALSTTRKRLCEQQWAAPGVAWPMHVAGWIDAQWFDDLGKPGAKLTEECGFDLMKTRGRSLVPKPKKPRRPRKRK